MGAHLSAYGLRSLPLSAVTPPSVSTRQVLGPAQGIHSAPGYAEQIKGEWGLCAYGLRSLPLSAVVRSSIGPPVSARPCGGLPCPGPLPAVGPATLRSARPPLCTAGGRGGPPPLWPALLPCALSSLSPLFVLGCSALRIEAPFPLE